MAGKLVQVGTNARERSSHSVDILANALCVALGPKGRNVLRKSQRASHIDKDVIILPSQREHANKFGEKSAQPVREIALSTSKLMADGTTRAIALARPPRQATIQGGRRRPQSDESQA